MKIAITTTESTTHKKTSVFVKVKIDVEPKSVLQTSPEIFADAENKFTIRYPKANEETEIRAMAASPFILAFWPVLSRRIAAKIVTGRIIIVLFERCRTVATESAPKATWLNPSPIKEKRFKTKVTPSKEEHKAIRTPQIIAYCTNGNEKYVFSVEKTSVILIKISFMWHIDFFFNFEKSQKIVQNISKLFFLLLVSGFFIVLQSK